MVLFWFGFWFGGYWLFLFGWFVALVILIGLCLDGVLFCFVVGLVCVCLVAFGCGFSVIVCFEVVLVYGC